MRQITKKTQNNKTKLSLMGFNPVNAGVMSGESVQLQVHYIRQKRNVKLAPDHEGYSA